MRPQKILNISPPNANLQNTIAAELGISKIIAHALISRGVKSIEEAEKFIHTDLADLLSPYHFSDMQRAVERIKQAAINKERVMIFGDYDVDGITALTLLKNTLSKIGLDAVSYLPHRIKEGYGLNKNILHLTKAKNIKLLITVDCGTNSHDEIQELQRNHIDVIITDHHETSIPVLPPAYAVINPKIKNSQYAYRDLAGVGVAYKLCQALTGDALVEDLDLVSLGTIADVVPLTGENRVIAKEGLMQLSKTKKAGLKALIESSGIGNKKITPTFVSYILGPRINASGRMDTAEIALNLLLCEAKEEAESFAKVVETYNRQRQKIEGKILEEAQDLIDREINFKDHKIIVIAKEGWHQGVLGIVASKLADRFYRPTILISLSDTLCKGSGRSIKNFHLFHALIECKEFLNTFGGHAHAVGLVIDRGSIEDFKAKINDLATTKLHLEDLLPSLNIDMELSLADLSEELIQGLKILEPFGTGNPAPLFYTRNLKLKGEPQILARDTLKFWVTDGQFTCQAIGFGMGGFRESLVSADCLDLVYSPQLDSWNGEESILLEAKDIFFR